MSLAEQLRDLAFSISQAAQVAQRIREKLASIDARLVSIDQKLEAAVLCPIASTPTERDKPPKNFVVGTPDREWHLSKSGLANIAGEPTNRFSSKESAHQARQIYAADPSCQVSLEVYDVDDY